MSEGGSSAKPTRSNRVRELREDLLMTRGELARRAGVSLRTIWSVERGGTCRVLTKRKILQALGIPKEEHRKVFLER